MRPLNELPMICAVVLAAGRSRRARVQKLLLPFAGSTVIEHVLDQVLASDVAEVYIVVPPDNQAVAEAVAGRPVHLVSNPDRDSEMLASVRCGLRALAAECQAVLVIPGDMPGITTQIIDLLIQAYCASEQRIAVPVHEGKHGHPILFSIDYRDTILQHYEGVGLRQLLRDYSHEVLEVQVSSPAVLADIDNLNGYRRLLHDRTLWGRR